MTTLDLSQTKTPVRLQTQMCYGVHLLNTNKQEEKHIVYINDFNISIYLI